MRPQLLTPIVLIMSLAAPGASALGEDRQDYDLFVGRLGEQLEVQGEFALRVIALGLENYELVSSSETRDQVAADEPVCFFDKPTGRHFTHLICREARDIGIGVDKPTTGGSSADFSMGGFGNGVSPMMTVSRHIFMYPAREREVRNYVEQLPGLPEMNQRLVTEGMVTRMVPVGLPTRAELDLFVAAYLGTRQIGNQYDLLIERASDADRTRLRLESDRVMAEAIEEVGLSVDRYNQIVEHVSYEPELFAYVRERVTVD